MSFPMLRKRTAPAVLIPADYSAAHASTGVLPAQNPPQQNVKTGAAARIMRGIFGVSNPPSANLSAEVRVPRGMLYSYHEGDLFTPGTQNYVFEYPFEFPIQTIWGQGFLRKPNTFNPRQPRQVFSQPNIVVNGVGGLQAGQISHQPLETTGQ